MAGPRLIQGRRETALRDHLRMVAKRHGLELSILIEDQLRITVQDLAANTPKDTGAGAGTTVGAKRNMYRSHPGFGMRIGNEPGDTGWQIMSINPQHWAITNPMWVDYLRKVNYEHPNGNFLENAVQRLRQRMVTLASQRGN